MDAPARKRAIVALCSRDREAAFFSTKKHVRKTTQTNVSKLTLVREGERGTCFFCQGASFSFRRPRLPTTDRRRRMTSSGSRAVHLAVDPAPHTKLCDMLPTKSTATTGANKSSRDPTYLLGGDIPPATPNPSPQLSGEGLQDSGRLDCRRA